MPLSTTTPLSPPPSRPGVVFVEVHPLPTQSGGPYHTHTHTHTHSPHRTLTPHTHTVTPPPHSLAHLNSPASQPSLQISADTQFMLLESCILLAGEVGYTHSLTHPPTHSLTHARTHSDTHSHTHSLIHSDTHSLTHSLTRKFTPSVTLNRTHLPSHPAHTHPPSGVGGRPVPFPEGACAGCSQSAWGVSECE